MKKLVLLKIVVAVLIFLLSSCGMQTGKAKFPESSPDFQPQRVYNVGYDKMWDTIINTLEENRITIASLDKSSGIINTDYIQGASTVYGLGFGGVGQSRYKYNITMNHTGQNMVKVGIICKLESTLSGAAGTTPWRDLSQENAPLVTKLENWLYEQIEKSL